MIVVRASGYLFDHQIRYPIWEPTADKLQQWLKDLNIGGVILLGGSACEIAQRTQQLQSWANIPLLIAADIEEGVGQRFGGATWFPPPMALGAIANTNLQKAQDYARAMGEITAKEALAMGINWLLAPVVDVNNNPENPVINVRSFGSNPDVVGELASCFIQGASSYPVLTTAKHFPGHGDTAADSHLALPVLPHSPSRLATVEIPPFQRAIATGVDSIMSAHVLIPEWDQQYPATLSSAILTGQLRQNLGFEGLIVTDALIMAGVANYASSGEIAVRAIEAGADILLMPADPVVAINAVTEAVLSGRLTPERIYQSIKRIKKAKLKLSQPTRSHFLEDLSPPIALETVNNILKDSLLRGGDLPLQPTKHDASINLVVVDNLLNCDFLPPNAPAVAIPQGLGYQLQLVEQNSLSLLSLPSTPCLLQIFSRGNPFRGSAGLTPVAYDYYLRLITAGLVFGILVYGSPYIMDWLKPLLPDDLPWVFSYGQMPQAQTIAHSHLENLSRFDDFLQLNFL